MDDVDARAIGVTQFSVELVGGGQPGRATVFADGEHGRVGDEFDPGRAALAQNPVDRGDGGIAFHDGLCADGGMAGGDGGAGAVVSVFALCGSDCAGICRGGVCAGVGVGVIFEGGDWSSCGDGDRGGDNSGGNSGGNGLHPPGISPSSGPPPPSGKMGVEATRVTCG